MACAEDATGRVPPSHRKRAAADARVECRDPDRVGLAGARESLAHGEILFALELGRGVREACDRIVRPRVDLRQLGDDLETDAIPREPQRPIRGVGARPDPRRSADRERVLPTDREQRPRDPPTQRTHAGEAGEPRASGEVKEHGLRLIVARVAGRDRGGADLFRGAAKKCIPRGPGGVLGLCRRVGAAYADRRTDAVGELRDEVSFCRALFGSRAVIEVRDVDGQAELLREVGQDEEEGSRIGAAGYRDDHRSRGEDVVRADVVADGRADRGRDHWWLGWGSDPRPRGYESRALPLSYPAEQVDSSCLAVDVLGQAEPETHLR